MDIRTNRIALLLLFLNIGMILVGVFGMAWQASHAAARPSVPTNLAWAISCDDRGLGLRS